MNYEMLSTALVICVICWWFSYVMIKWLLEAGNLSTTKKLLIQIVWVIPLLNVTVTLFFVYKMITKDMLG